MKLKQKFTKSIYLTTFFAVTSQLLTGCGSSRKEPAPLSSSSPTSGPVSEDKIQPPIEMPHTDPETLVSDQNLNEPEVDKKLEKENKPDRARISKKSLAQSSNKTDERLSREDVSLREDAPLRRNVSFREDGPSRRNVSPGRDETSRGDEPSRADESSRKSKRSKGGVPSRRDESLRKDGLFRRDETLSRRENTSLGRVTTTSSISDISSTREGLSFINPVSSQSVVKLQRIPQLKNNIYGIGSSLFMRVIPEADHGIQPDFPDANIETRSLTIKKELTAQNNEIQFHSKLFLPDPLSKNPEKRKNLFLVWPEDSLGARILTATFAHQVLNADKRVIGNFQPQQAWHDVVQRRWYIPISKLFEHALPERGFPSYSEKDVSIDDTQLIHLDLGLENGQAAHVQVQFQIEGPLPKLQLNPLAVSSPDQAELFVKEVSQNGLSVLREQLTNPTARTFNLWVQAEEYGQSLELETILSAPNWIQHGNDPAVSANPDILSSTGRMVVDQLQVIPTDGGTELKSFNQRRWVMVQLQPHETLTLEWLAHPASSTVNCTVPEPQNLHFSWTRLSEAAVYTLGAYKGAKFTPRIPDPIVHHQSFEKSFQIVYGELRGEWTRQIRLAHSFISEDEATLENSELIESGGEFLELTRSTNASRFFAGEMPPFRAGQLRCQGVFK